MDDERAGSRGPRAEHEQRPVIDPVGEILLILRAIDRGIRGRIDDDIRLHGMQGRVQRLRIGEIDGGDALRTRACGDVEFAKRRERSRQLEADLPVRAEQQDFHCATATPRFCAPMCASRNATIFSYICVTCASV